MSRIGLLPIPVPAGVTVTVGADNVVNVKGPKGELVVNVSPLLTIEQGEGEIKITRADNERTARSQHGLARTLLNNAVVGVTAGHQKILDIIGVGYRVQLDGRDLMMNLGYSHPVKIIAAPGITFEVAADDKARTQNVKVSGIDKAMVGQMAADIRKVRKPDPYKGKGVRYRGEVIKLKAGKRAAGKK